MTGYDDRVLQSILELEPGVRVLGKPFAPEDLAEGIAALTAREVTSPAP